MLAAVDRATVPKSFPVMARCAPRRTCKPIGTCLPRCPGEPRRWMTCRRPSLRLRKNRKQPREYDKALYKLRHLVENAFLHFKRWRGIATRYAKNVSSFVAAVQTRCLALWMVNS